MPASFLWHDYETFGALPRLDRPSEFACIRTGPDFVPLEPGWSARCQPPLDYLPDPEACLITGIGPETAYATGLPEPEFAARVFAEMAVPDTCSVGYNNMRFDDEISRYLFWRNFIDPYEREWANGNSRFDLIDLVRACHALRPDGMDWAVRDDGHPSFKLTDLSAANGISHRHAHSALSDVEATLALARKLKAAQPKLLEYALGLRNKARVQELLNWQQRKPVVHVSQRISAERGCLAIIVPLAPHPTQAGKTIVVDAHYDPTPLLNWSAERVAEAILTPASTSDRVPVGIKLVHANRAPFLAPLNVLEGVDLPRIHLDRALVDIHVQRIRGAEALDAKLQEIYALLDRAPDQPETDVDGALYDGFVDNADRALARRFREADADEQAHLALKFRDPRLQALALRYRARHHPLTLTRSERRLWHKQVEILLNRPERPLPTFLAAAEALAGRAPALAAELAAWATRVENAQRRLLAS